MRSITLLCLIVIGLQLVVTKSVQIKGLSREDQSLLKFDTKSFTCQDGSRTIPFSQVNDNFCDCEADGSDEPGTSACSNGKFYCRNKGYVGKHIYSMQVDDGICDCCDGSDEENNSKASCPNTCSVLALEANRAKQEELDAHLQGLNVKKTYIQKAETELAEKKAQISTLNAELEQLRATKEKETELKNKLQEEEEAAKKQYEEAHAIAAQSTEQQPQSTTEEEEEEEEEEATTPEEEAAAQAEEEQYHEEIASSTKTEDNSEKDEFLKPFREASEKQGDVVRELQNKISSLESQLNNINNILNINFGEDNAFYALYGECYKAETPEYTYELCPFDKVSQISKRGGGSTNLGKWSNDESGEEWSVLHKYMKYTGGQRCWGGPDRSCKVELICAKENRLTDPAEPNKCEYTLKFYTPAACNEAHAQALQLSLEGGHEEEEEY